MSVNSTQKFFHTFDTLSTLVSELNLDDAINTIKACEHKDDDKGTLNEIERQRTDITVFFRKLTDNPEELIRTMIQTNTLLSGSRAVQYMYPHFNCDGSDWDFYCQYGTRNKAFEQYLYSLGAIEDKSIEANNYSPYGKFNIKYFTLRKDKATYTIQTISPINARHTAFEIIASFYCTTVQCFITGYAAVAMYHKLNKDRKLLQWTGRNNSKLKQFRKHNENCELHHFRNYLINHALGEPVIMYEIMNRMTEIREIFDIEMKSRRLNNPDESVNDSRDFVINEQLPLHSVNSVLHEINSSGTDDYTTDFNTLLNSIILGECTCTVYNPIDTGISKYTERGFKHVEPSEVRDLTDNTINVRRLHEEPRSMVIPLLDYINDKEITEIAEGKLVDLYNTSWYEINDGINTDIIATHCTTVDHILTEWYDCCDAIDLSPGGI